jgi:hypothetical protein
MTKDERNVQRNQDHQFHSKRRSWHIILLRTPPAASAFSFGTINFISDPFSALLVHSGRFVVDRQSPIF